jgi:hypothetical protein
MRQTWVYGYDRKLDVNIRSACRRSLQGRTKRVSAFQSAFHCVECTVYYEYVPHGQQWINITVLKFWSDWGSPLVERGQRNGNLARELCKTTKHPPTYLVLFSFFFFWGGGGQITSRLWFRKHHIPWHGSLRLLAVPPNLNSTKRKEIRRHWHHQREHKWSTWWLFRKAHFKNVSNDGRNAGINVWVQKETILKGINYLLL